MKGRRGAARMIRLSVITPDNVSVFKTVRLRALLDAPKAFASTHAAESQLSDAEWLSRAARFVAWSARSAPRGRWLRPRSRSARPEPRADGLTPASASRAEPPS